MSIPFCDIVSDHGIGNAHALKRMLIVHSYRLERKPNTENFFM